MHCTLLCHTFYCIIESYSIGSSSSGGGGGGRIRLANTRLSELSKSLTLRSGLFILEIPRAFTSFESHTLFGHSYVYLRSPSFVSLRLAIDRIWEATTFQEFLSFIIIIITTTTIPESLFLSDFSLMEADDKKMSFCLNVIHSYFH